MWVVFIGRIFAGSCKSRSGIPRRPRGRGWEGDEAGRRRGTRTAKNSTTAFPLPSPPPRVAHHHHSHRHRRPSARHWLDSTALRDDGTTGQGRLGGVVNRVGQREQGCRDKRAKGPRARGDGGALRARVHERERGGGEGGGAVGRRKHDRRSKTQIERKKEGQRVGRGQKRRAGPRIRRRLGKWKRGIGKGGIGRRGKADGVEKFNCAYFRSDVSQILCHHTSVPLPSLPPSLHLTLRSPRPLAGARPRKTGMTLRVPPSLPHPSIFNSEPLPRRRSPRVDQRSPRNPRQRHALATSRVLVRLNARTALPPPRHTYVCIRGAHVHVCIKRDQARLRGHCSHFLPADLFFSSSSPPPPLPLPSAFFQPFSFSVSPSTCSSPLPSPVPCPPPSPGSSTRSLRLPLLPPPLERSTSDSLYFYCHNQFN